MDKKSKFSVLPVSGLYSVYEEKDKIFKVPVVGIGCFWDHDDEGGNITYTLIEQGDISEGFTLFDGDAGRPVLPKNFKGILWDNPSAIDLTDEEKTRIMDFPIG